MKKLKFTAVLVALTTLTSCGGGIGTQPINAEGFGKIETQLKSKFGENAHYTDLTITYNAAIGNIVNATVTDTPESLKMGEWTFSNGNWVQTSEVFLELPEGTKATEFMFQLNEDASLHKLGELVEESKSLLTKDKNIENPMLHMALVSYPDNGDIAKAQFVVMLQPETGGTTFTYSYRLNGEFIEMDY